MDNMIHQIDKQVHLKCLTNKHYLENTVRKELEYYRIFILSSITTINPMEILGVKNIIRDSIKLEIKKHQKKPSIFQRIIGLFK